MKKSKRYTKKINRYTVDEFCEFEKISQRELAERLGTNKDAITRAKKVGWVIHADGDLVELMSCKGSYRRSELDA